MDASAIIQLEQQHVLGVYNRAPFVIVRGEGCTLYDTEGKAYLDCLAGIAVNALGYSDPGVNQAIAEAAQSGVLHVSNLFHTAPHARLAQLLCANSFADKVHFSLTGADANEGAFKFARRYAREQGHEDKHHIVAFSGSFHGRLFGSLAATARPEYQRPFEPLMPGVRFAEYNDLDSARAQVDGAVCAIIVEAIQGEGGIRPADAEFLRGLRALADEHDALLIFDEVQCGLGRTGNLWGYETVCSGGDRGRCSDCDGGAGPCVVAPDLMTLAKPLAGGLPIGAILMRQRVADAIHKGDHAGTFAGGTMTTRVGHYIVSRVAEPAFLAEVRRKGALLRELLGQLSSAHVVEVRGVGLIVGVELDIPAKPIVAELYRHGVIMGTAGEKVLRLVPPLVISDDELARAVDALAQVLRAQG